MGSFPGFQKSDDYYIHPRLGQIKRIQKEDGPQMIEYKVLVESQDIVTQWIQSINMFYNSPCQDIILLPKSHFYERIGYCGKHCELFLLFEDYMFSLKDEIKSRQKIKRHFAESSVWQILYKLIKTESFLQKLKLRIGNVKPENFLVNQDGQIRIISSFTWPNSQFIIMSQTQQNNDLLSPQQLRHSPLNAKIHRQLNQNQLTSQKSKQQYQSIGRQYNNSSQIFSIGMTLLQICSLQDSKEIYKPNEIQQLQIRRRLMSLKPFYSLSLISLIFQMLKIDVQSRITIHKILEILKDYEQQILSQKSFQIGYNLKNPFQNGISNNLQIQNDILQSKAKEQKYTKSNKIGSLFPFLRNMCTQSSINIKKMSDKDRKKQLNLTLSSAKIY